MLKTLTRMLRKHQAAHLINAMSDDQVRLLTEMISDAQRGAVTGDTDRRDRQAAYTGKTRRLGEG